MIAHRIQRIFLLFFAALLFTGTAGIYFYGSLNAAMHRRANLKRRTHDEIVTLTLSKTAFRSIVWVGDKDFLFEGELYDIEGFAEVNGNYVLHCEKDECETTMFDAIEKQLNTDHTQKGSKNTKQFSFCFEYLIPSETAPFFKADQPLTFGCTTATGFSPAFIHLASPPPEA